MTHSAGWIAAAAAFGAVIGSFLNVVIHRLPRGESVAAGRSKCPRCRQTIAWYDNVPVLSWILLRAKCRRCGGAISVRYPVVEALTAASAAAAAWSAGWTLAGAWVFAFLAVMIVVTWIDWEHQIIPDELSLGGTVLGWIGAAVCLDITLVESLVGAVVGAGLVLAIALLYRAARKVDGMGMGDVKLMAMIGAFLGWEMVFAVLFAAALAGSAYGIYLVRTARGDGRTAVAFGSFLAPAAVLMMFAGERLFALYLAAAWASK